MKKQGIYFIIVLLVFLLVPTSVSAHWFQTVSGDVYSNGNINISNLSQGGTPTSYLSANNANRGSSGVITYIAGSPSFGTVRASQDDTNSTNTDQRWAQQRNTSNSPLLVLPDDGGGYNGYFTAMRNKFENDPDLPVSTSPPSSSNLRNVTRYCHPLPPNPDGVWILENSLVIDDCPPGNDFGPNAGQSIVIFVSGPVTIRDNITVPNAQNTFFMIVSNTSITFHNDVSNNGGLPVVGGVYIAPTINTSNDSLFVAQPLVAEGVFYALNQFNLNRRTSDQSIPSETFLYKPSLMISAPQELWDTFSEYQEVEP